jgi:RNA polymerase sigma factor for flagellar operon FliA
VDYAGQLSEALPLVDDVVRFVGRRHHLSVEETEELNASVRLKLIERDYEVLRAFQGRCSLRTYLTTVVQRHFLDARIAQWGKWRPSATAKRLGPAAVLLDRLLTRDGHSFEDAVTVLREHHRVELPDADLASIAAQLPQRVSRRFVGDGGLEELPAPADPAVDVAERRDEAARMDGALAAALDRLADDERLLLRLRFREDLSVADIARLLKIDQKPLYRRLERLKTGLRRELEAAGIRRDLVLALVGAPDVELDPVLGTGEVGIPETGPSTS